DEARRHGLRRWEVMVLSNLGGMLHDAGRSGRAIELLEEVIASSNEWLAFAWTHLAEARAQLGDFDAAERAGPRAQPAAEEEGDARAFAMAVAANARIAFERGDHVLAHSFATESLETGFERIDRVQASIAFAVLGAVHAESDAIEEAEDAFRRARTAASG